MHSATGLSAASDECERILQLAKSRRDLLQKLDNVLLTTTVIDSGVDLSQHPKRRDLTLHLYQRHGIGAWCPLHHVDVLAFGTLNTNAFADVAEERLAESSFTQIETNVRSRSATVLATYKAHRIRITYNRLPSLDHLRTGSLNPGNSPLWAQLDASYLNESLSSEAFHAIAESIQDPEVASGWLNMKATPGDDCSGNFSQALTLSIKLPNSESTSLSVFQDLLRDLFVRDSDPKWKSRPWPQLLQSASTSTDSEATSYVYILGLAKKNCSTLQTAILLAQWRDALQKTTSNLADSDAAYISQAQVDIVGEGELPLDLTFAEPRADRRSSPRASPQPTIRNHKEKIRLRPADDVYNRIKWDNSLDGSDYVIGYLDRFAGVLELPFEEWEEHVEEEDFVPMHRIRYFKRIGDGELMWDRHSRVDRLFGPA